ncbi:uncharacterized protein LOC129576898 [Sitodiplosis mosellana]|uniref:uncharacterized protein LOC129576898 n=1 Tax=Sitodiplosis mosellana TaxID=263140 RepID=UPI0024441BB9|nr:uncharacterized protein LOC129576898 [Sitodiplosis mosellana]
MTTTLRSNFGPTSTLQTMADKLGSMQMSEKSLAGVPQLLVDLQRLSEDQETSDIVFIVDREEERIYAHKIILQARCRSFQTTKRDEFCRIPGSTVSPNVPGNPTQIRLPHINASVFRQFILYAYTGKITFQDSRVFELMTLAQDLGIDELKAACEDYVVSTLSVTNACTYLAAVMDIHDKSTNAKSMASFLERCTSYIGENATECVKTSSFLSLPKEGIIKLISSDYFCLEEEDVWRCVLVWAKHKAGVTSLQPGRWTEDERTRVCQHLAGVINHVRLLLIDSQVFAEEVEPTGAVPMELSLERYRHAALQTSSKAPFFTNSSIPGSMQISSSTVPSSGNNMMTGNTGTSIASFGESDKRLQPRLLQNLFPGSSILKNDKLHLQTTLNAWYGVPKQNWRLVFRASANGFSASAFHRYCDGVAPVFVIAQSSRGEISGGFTDVPWAKTNRKGGYIHSERSFLFTLYNEQEPPTKYDIIKKPYAICYHPEVGPIFGAGADLQIANACNTNMDSYSNLPHSYDGGNNASSSSLFGDYNFTITEYEAYTLASAPSPPVNKFKNERF